ncbi:MAG: hypothetical protein Kow00129_17450 [Thermoleophilia bacterium]
MGRVRSGVDVVEIDRFRAALERRPRLRERLFVPGELERCLSRRDPIPCLAVRFAAKEAVGKLLGTGVLSWQEIEIVGSGPPRLRLAGRTAAVAAREGVADEISLSLSHSKFVAVAVAVAVTVAAGLEAGTNSDRDGGRGLGDAFDRGAPDRDAT